MREHLVVAAAAHDGLSRCRVCQSSTHNYGHRCVNSSVIVVVPTIKRRASGAPRNKKKIPNACTIMTRVDVTIV